MITFQDMVFQRPTGKHFMLQYQESQILSLHPFAHPISCIHSESISKPNCLNLLLTAASLLIHSHLNDDSILCFTYLLLQNECPF